MTFRYFLQRCWPEAALIIILILILIMVIIIIIIIIIMFLYIHDMHSWCLSPGQILTHPGWIFYVTGPTEIKFLAAALRDFEHEAFTCNGLIWQTFYCSERSEYVLKNIKCLRTFNKTKISLQAVSLALAKRRDHAPFENLCKCIDPVWTVSSITHDVCQFVIRLTKHQTENTSL